jgi:phage terminase large subunit
VIRICEKYAPLDDANVREVVEGSGRCTAKSTSNEIIAAALMMKSGRNNIWYCRAEKSDIRDTIFSSFVSTLQLMEVDKLFTWSLSPMRVKCISTGAICYFDAINGKTDDDMTATKGFTPQYKTLAMCILDEADQVKHYNHITAWTSTAARFLLPEAKTVYAYNPPMNKNHWAYKFFGDKVRNGAANIYATWEDIRGLLSERVIQDILKFKRDDPEYYKYWYLGQPVSFKGMVYPQFNRDRHVINIHRWLPLHSRDRFTEVIFGLDEGTVNDSTCVTCLGILGSGIAVALDCLEIDPLVDGQRAPTETSRILSGWLRDTVAKFPFLFGLRRRWIFESAEGGQMLRLQFVQDTGEDTCIVTQKSIMGDVKRVRSMLAEGLLLFHDDFNVTTDVLTRDIENYVFDEKTGDIKKQQRDDTIDSLEYATKLYYNVPM